MPAPWPMLTPENQDSVLVLETSQLHRESHLCGLGKGQSQGESVSRRVCYVGTGKDLGVGVGVFEKGHKRQGWVGLRWVEDGEGGERGQARGRALLGKGRKVGPVGQEVKQQSWSGGTDKVLFRVF